MQQERHKIGSRRKGRFSKKHKLKEKSTLKPPPMSGDCQVKTVSAIARRSIRYARTKGYFWGLGRLLVTTSKADNPQHENEDVRSCLNRLELFSFSLHLELAATNTAISSSPDPEEAISFAC